MKGKRILLGVSGGIAAYKAADLVRAFVKADATVQVVMTENATRFITPLTLQTLSGRTVGTDLFNMEHESRIGHIDTARSADAVVLAPATANLIAKMAAGIADDYLTTILLATTAPILVCPAMNVKMYENPVTQRNLETLRSLGHRILEPAAGFLACREEGTGRLADVSDICEATRRLLTPPSLAGRRVMIGAGPTWEFFDPVRFMSNPSTGKMGYALAAVAARRSAEVHLVSGPSALPVPSGVVPHSVVTALDMRKAVMETAPGMDVIVMAAAVSDYRPREAAPQKLKKTAGEMNVAFVGNPDILAEVGRSRSSGKPEVLVGFAAETENLIANAKEKLNQKNLDFIVANDLTQQGSGFACDTNQVKIIDRGGTILELPRLTKEEVAEQVWDHIERLMKDRTSHGAE